MAHLYSYFSFSNNDALPNKVVPNFNSNNKLSVDDNQKWTNNSNHDNNVNKFGFEEPKWKTNNNNNSNNHINEDQQWNMVATKLAIHEQMRAKFDQTRNVAHPVQNMKGGGGGAIAGYGGNIPKSPAAKQPLSKAGGKHKSHGKSSSASTQNDVVDSMINKVLNLDIKQKGATDPSQKGLLAQPNVQSPGVQNSPTTDKRFKTLPPSESLPRNETLGGYIFVCNNDTMQEDLKRQLFGLPQRYRDSVRAIQPGLPLFLYNYTTHQLHGIFEAASFGGSNIDPTAWEDKKNKGESRFPAQVRIRIRKVCKPLEEDAFRPVLYHYDGPKFRLMLSIPETLALMDLLSENGAP